MTKIFLYGKIAKIFGPIFNVKIKNAVSAIKAIDANKKNFLKTLIDLNKNQYDYCLIVDGKKIKNIEELQENKRILTIHIVPIIFGCGEFVATFLGLVDAAGQLTTLGDFVATVVNLAANMAIQLGISFLMNKMNNQASLGDKNVAVGGATKLIEAQGKSYVFSNPQNTATQGASIPVGYGKMKANSSIIYFSIKNYPTNRKYTDEFIGSELYTAYNDFLAN